MKKKSYIFIRSCLYYLLFALVPGFLFNCGVLPFILISSRDWNPALIIGVSFFLSMIFFTLFACVILYNAWITGSSEKKMARVAFVIACIGLICLVPVFYDTAYKILFPLSSDRLDENLDKLISLWLTNTGLGVLFGLVVLSSGLLLRRSQQKPTLDELP